MLIKYALVEEEALAPLALKNPMMSADFAIMSRIELELRPCRAYFL